MSADQDGFARAEHGAVRQLRYGGVNGSRFSAIGGVPKRAADLLIASIGICLLAPLLVLVALAVRLTSPGPALFGHERIGLNGQPFLCWKFRTMRADANTVLAAYLDSDPALAREWEETRKLRRDPRITRLGRILREYSVDELPQLLNVLRGDMSIVGPRPVVAAELARYGSAAEHYLAARPGITGLWQVSGRSDTSYGERVQLDLSYVSNWSFVGDVRIILRTVPAVIGSRGAC
ncbi:sugar transferase [Rhodobacterales bacterium HKCCE3408]|nr:sugar transferase [Rhodobacterales bacterium HKCCE3408]